MYTVYCEPIQQKQQHHKYGFPHLYVLFPCYSGLEHHVPQLVDLCAAAVGVSHLDPACQVPIALTELIRTDKEPDYLYLYVAVLIDSYRYSLCWVSVWSG